MAVRMIGVSGALKKVQGRADKLMRALVLETTSRLVTKTPVDTGRARGNWQVGTKVAAPGGTGDTDKSGTGSIAKAASILQSLNVGETVYITNGLPYIKALEDGHSTQAPQGMVKTTVAELKAFSKGIIKEINRGG